MSLAKLDLLVVGGDDSNHAGTAKGEIDVATFSSLLEDSLVRNFPNTRNHGLTEKWLDSPNRDYRYTLLTAERYRHSSQNLIETIPKLVRHYLDEKDLEVKTLKIFLDGIINSGGRQKIREQLLGFRGIDEVVANNFTKKPFNKMKHMEKHPQCPAVVYHADVLANYIYNLSMGNERLIMLD